MKKSLKRLLALLMVWTLVLPTTAYAADSKPTGMPQSIEEKAVEYQDSGCFDIKKMSMDELKTLYQNVTECPSELYEVTPVTGENYKAGKLASQPLQHAEDYINFIRTQAGLPKAELDAKLNESAEYGALTLAMRDKGLSHTPEQPEFMSKEDYNKGYAATSTSNISSSKGYDSEDVLRIAVQGQMDDEDARNIDRVGHRRWLLKPQTKTFGIGNAKSDTGWFFTCVRVFGEGVQSNTVDYDFVSWPASGNMLREVFGANVPWSVTVNPVYYQVPDASKVKVELIRLSDGKQFTFDQNDYTDTPNEEQEYFNVEKSNYGVNNCIIFRPIVNEIEEYAGEYDVHITGLYDKQGTEKELRYKVNFDAVVPLTSISLDRTNLELDENGWHSLQVTYNPENTTDNRTVTWTSSDENVATVTWYGLVEAVAPGTAVITAKVGSKTAKCTVTVTGTEEEVVENPTLTSLAVHGDLSNLSAPTSFDVEVGVKAPANVGVFEVVLSYWNAKTEKRYEYRTSYVDDYWYPGIKGETCTVKVDLNQWADKGTYELQGIYLWLPGGRGIIYNKNDDGNMESMAGHILSYSGEADFTVAETVEEDMVIPKVTSVKMLTTGAIYPSTKVEFEAGYEEDASGIKTIDVTYKNTEIGDLWGFTYRHNEEEENRVGTGTAPLTFQGWKEGTYQIHDVRVEDYAGNYRSYIWNEESGKLVSTDAAALEISLDNGAKSFIINKPKSNGLKIKSLRMVNAGKDKTIVPGQEIEAVVTVYNDIDRAIQVDPKGCLVSWACWEKDKDIYTVGEGEEFTLKAGAEREISFKTTISTYEANGHFTLNTVRLNEWARLEDPAYPVTDYTFYYYEDEQSGYGYGDKYFYTDGEIDYECIDEVKYNGELELYIENQKEDTEAPIIDHVEVVGQNDIIKAPGKVTFKIYTEEEDVAKIKEFAMRFVDTDPERKNNIIGISQFMMEDGTIPEGLKYSEAEKCYIYEYKLDESIIKGNYVLQELYIMDEAGQSRSYWMEDLNSMKLDDSNGNIFDSCRLEVAESSCTDYDFGRPELVDIKNVGGYTLTPTGSIKYLIDVNDPSGLSGAMMICWADYTINKEILTLSVDEGSITKTENGYLCEFKPEGKCVPGTYELTRVMLYDGSVRKNSSLYWNEEDGLYDDGTQFDPVRVSEKFIFTVVDKVVKDIAGAAISVKDQTYTGNALTPGVTVTLDGTVLQKGTDYTVAYANNTNAGTATVTITGKGDYKGTVTKTFKIQPKSVAATTATLSGTSYTYSGKAITPSVTVKSGDVTLQKDKDYTVAYANNTKVGTATVTITGKGNYTGTVKKTFKINPRNISSSAAVTLSAVHHTYTGNVKTPTVTVKYGSTVLKKNTDYTVSYSSGRKYIGRYAVKVTFRGNYSGSKTMYFTIGPKNPTSVTTSLYGYDDVQLRWSKVSGASGYVIYYKKSTSSSYVKLGVVSAAATSYKKANLADGAQYTFKVVAYKKVGSYNCYNAGKTSSIYTLRRTYTPVVSAYGSKVKVRWSNIAGESGYQISQSTTKTGTKIVSTYATTSGNYRYVSAAKGKYYYYKVRAYRQVGKTKIYGPWSTAVRYRK